MKVCYVCCEYPPAIHGGIGAVIQSTSRALVKSGHQVRVIGLYPPTEDAPEHEDDQGVQVWRLRSSNRPLSWIPERYRLFKMVQEWAKNGDIDVVEVPDWEGHVMGWPRLEVPVVVRLHGSITYFGSEMKIPVKRQAQWIESKSFHRADFASSCSSYTAKRTNQLFGQHAKETAVLYNSVQLSQAAPAVTTREPNMVIYAGTLTRKKGIIQLIKAWPQVLAANSDARLHVFGKDAGTEQGEVTELAQQHDVVEGLDCAEPVDEFVEVESIGPDPARRPRRRKRLLPRTCHHGGTSGTLPEMRNGDFPVVRGGFRDGPPGSDG